MDLDSLHSHSASNSTSAASPAITPAKQPGAGRHAHNTAPGDQAHARQCRFVAANHWQCDQFAGESGLCFWHDECTDKSGRDLVAKVEQWVKSGRPLDGFKLANANLAGIDLVHQGSMRGYSCIGADFYGADLSKARLYKLDARHCSFRKADLSRANMHRMRLQGSNFLGADLTQTNLEQVQWGRYIFQERQAFRARQRCDQGLQRELWREAEEAARLLRQRCEQAGLLEQAGSFFIKEMRARRQQLPKFSLARGLSKIVDLLCGYGESPQRVVYFSLGFILTCALSYFFAGNLTSANLDIAFQPQSSLLHNITNFGHALYFSVVTFTTLGYGDIVPQGPTRILAAIEAFLGSFTLALFVVVFVKKMTR